MQNNIYNQLNPHDKMKLEASRGIIEGSTRLPTLDEYHTAIREGRYHGTPIGQDIPKGGKAE